MGSWQRFASSRRVSVRRSYEKVATSIHWEREDPRLEAGLSRDSRLAPLSTPAPAYLSAGQADDPLASIQVPAAVACAEQAG